MSQEAVLGILAVLDGASTAFWHANSLVCAGAATQVLYDVLAAAVGTIYSPESSSGWSGTSTTAATRIHSMDRHREDAPGDGGNVVHWGVLRGFSLELWRARGGWVGPLPVASVAYWLLSVLWSCATATLRLLLNAVLLGALCCALGGFVLSQQQRGRGR